jgi:hypothetical protein
MSSAFAKASHRCFSSGISYFRFSILCLLISISSMIFCLNVSSIFNSCDFSANSILSSSPSASSVTKESASVFFRMALECALLRFGALRYGYLLNLVLVMQCSILHYSALRLFSFEYVKQWRRLNTV